jgi:hypothetical protein
MARLSLARVAPNDWSADTTWLADESLSFLMDRLGEVVEGQFIPAVNAPGLGRTRVGLLRFQSQIFHR